MSPLAILLLTLTILLPQTRSETQAREKIKCERGKEENGLLAPKFNTEALDDEDDDCSFVEFRPAKRSRTDSGVAIDLDD